MAQALLTKTQATWHYRGGSADVTLPTELLEAVNGQQVLARLLYNRGITTKRMAQAFLEAPSRERLCPVSELDDAEKAIARISLAIEKQEPILIFGDFDVDGLTGTSIFYETLHHHLGANVSYYIPDRASEGHGLNTAALLRLKSSRHLKLVITTDTGISNFNEVALLNSFGVDTIVTDHHELPEHLPLAHANVNPQRLEDVETHPLGNLSGAGVAFKLCDALLHQHLPTEAALAASNALLDLTAIGLVADMVPLIGENRVLVQLGLEQLNTRERMGTRILLEKAGIAPEKPLNAETIGFTIGPRLNALGRLENATEGVGFLTGLTNEDVIPMADKLELLNKRRQELCDTTYREAEQQLQASGGLQGRKAIILANTHWNPGVIGIVASRLIEKYRLPTFMMVVDESAQQVRCSARSIPGFHLTEHLESMKELFLHMGGHSGAAGFALTLEKLDTFKNAMWQRCGNTLSDDDTRPLVEVDARLGFEYLHAGFCDALETLAPYGMENPSPIFVLEDMVIGAQRHIGAQKNHLKLLLQPGKEHDVIKGQPQHVEAFIWKCGEGYTLDASQRVHVAFSLDKNTFGQNVSVQLMVKDILPASKSTKALVKEHSSDTAQSKLAQHLSTQLNPSTTMADSEVGVEPRQWLDVRSRPQPAEYASRILMHEELGTQTLLYNEGKMPAIPFLKPDQMIHRGNARPCKVLILWDVPPALNELQGLLRTTQPEYIHLMGAKYHEVPLLMELPTYLKAFYQGANLLLQKAPNHVLPYEELRHRFATTDALLMASLGLCNTVSPLFSVMEHTRISLNTQAPPLEPEVLLSLAETPAYHSVKHLLEAIQQFRTHLLETPIHKVEALC
jgi:single-stranded-DNA-specific exonuclease RecJ